MSESFYRAFEDRYRGTRDDIKARLRVYLPFVEPQKLISEHCKAVDVGCGRGEWLELMSGIDIDAVGIDLDSEMLLSCRELGLSVEHGDAIAYVRALADESVSVISGFHVAEHIRFSELQALVEESLRVLKPAGVLILETPNSENIVVGASSFYLDPTHERPIPPMLLSFLPEFYGFARTKVLRLQEDPTLTRSDGVTLFGVLSGVSPDVAVVAQKAAASTADSALLDAAFGERYGIELETLADRYDADISAARMELTARLEALSHLQEELARSQERLVGSQEGHLAGIVSRLEKLTATLDGLDGIYEGISQDHSARLMKIELLLERVTRAQEKSWQSVLRGYLRVSSSLMERRSVQVKRVLKPYVVRVGKYIRHHPRLKAAAEFLLKPLPRVKRRRVRGAQPTTSATEETATSTTSERRPPMGD